MIYADVIDSRYNFTVLGKFVHLAEKLGISISEDEKHVKMIKKKLDDFALRLPPGTVLMLDELQALFQGLSDDEIGITANWLRNWMIAERSPVQFVVCGSSSAALQWALNRASKNGIDFLCYGDSAVSSNVLDSVAASQLAEFKRLTSVYHPDKIDDLERIISQSKATLVQSRGVLRVGDVNMLLKKEYCNANELLTRVIEIYSRDILPILKADKWMLGVCAQFVSSSFDFDIKRYSKISIDIFSF